MKILSNKINIQLLTSEIETQCSYVQFAYLFGSAQNGVVNNGSDIDIAVYVDDTSRKIDAIPQITGIVEQQCGAVDIDIVFLNNADTLLAFEVLKGRRLFVRENAKQLLAGFYSITCREYESEIFWRKKQLEYRGYEVQWNN